MHKGQDFNEAKDFNEALVRLSKGAKISIRPKCAHP